MLRRSSLLNILFLGLASLANVAAQLSPGPRQAACGFSWNNEVYILGGQLAPNTSSTTPVFTRTSAAPFDTNSVTWFNLTHPLSSATYYFDNTCAISSSGMFFGLQAPVNETLESESFLRYNLQTAQWVQTTPPSTGSLANPSRFFDTLNAHAVTLVQDRYLFVTGGVFYTSRTNTTANNQSFILDTQSLQWSNISMTGGPPIGLSYSGIASVADKVYIFGGKNEKIVSNLVYSFNITSHSWALEPATLDLNFTHIGAVVNTDRTKIYLVPGKVNDDINDLDSRVRIYDLVTNTISLATVTNNTSIPINRFRHTVFSLGNTMLVYGGLDSQNNLLDGLFAFDMNTLSWGTSVVSYTPVTTAKPTPASSSSEPILTMPTSNSTPISTSSATSSSSSTSAPTDHVPIIVGAVSAGAAAVIFAGIFIFYRRRKVEPEPNLEEFTPPERLTSDSATDVASNASYVSHRRLTMNNAV